MALTACGGAGTVSTPEPPGSDSAATTAGAAAGGRVLRVPAQYAAIQQAVDASRPGDLVLVSPGVYHEQVTVTDEHPRIVIRGLDRSRVILDGRDRLGDGISVHADAVAVENLTVRHYAVNGVVWARAAGIPTSGST